MRTYHVYGRKSHPEPLAFVGKFKIGDPGELKEEAFRHLGESGWVELIAFPEASIVRVIPGGGQKSTQ